MDRERIRNWTELEEGIEKTASLHGNRVADLVTEVAVPRVACPTCGESIQADEPDTDTLAQRWSESVRKQMIALVNSIDVIDYNVDAIEDQMMSMVPIIRAMKAVMKVLKETEAGIQSSPLSSEEMSDVLVGAFANIEQIIMGAMTQTDTEPE